MPSWKRVIVSGSDASLNSLNITAALTASGIIYPSADGTTGQVLTTNGSGQLSFSTISSGGTGSSVKLSQTVAATTWSFAHNLNEKFPAVTVYDSNDEVIIPQKIDAIDNNNMLVYFSSPTTGTAAAVVGGSTVSASYSEYAVSATTATSASFATSASVTPNGTSIVGGTGTTNYIPKFTGASALGNSSIQDLTTGVLINNSITAASAIARGTFISPTLVAAANNDVLVGLDINPTFTNGAFTGVQNVSARINGLLRAINPSSTTSGFFGGGTASPSGVGLGTINSGVLPFIQGYNNLVSLTTPLSINPSGGNVLIGSSTDAGFRLDVNGLQAFRGTTASDTAPLGAELAAVTGTGTGWTLAGTNLNVGGYTHTTGDVTPLTTTLAAVSGTYYQIAYTITGRTTGSITINYGGISASGITATGATGPLASSTAALTITPTTDFNGTVVLSIKSIGTSSATTTFTDSTRTIRNEIRANNSLDNTSLGIQSNRRITTGIYNTAIGAYALRDNTTGSSNTAVGRTALYVNTTGVNNTAVGQAGLFSNTIGNNNTAIGKSSLQANTTGVSNTAIGSESLFVNTTGNYNTGVGYVSLDANTTGGNNTGIGYAALGGNTTGNNNTSIGYASLAANTTGTGNAALGLSSLLNIVGASGNNTAIGTYAGRYAGGGTTAMTAVNNSIYIGYQTRGLNATGSTNEIVIGYDVVGLGSNTTSIGNSSTTATAIYGDLLLGSTTDNGTDKLQVTGTVKVSSSVQVGDNATAASATNVGAIRYRSDANNSYMDMVMQTGASTYEWVNIVQNNW